MNLIELVNYFREGKSLEEFYQENFLNEDTEVVEIYMEKPFTILNKLVFFEIEETDGNIEHIFEENLYYNLIDIYFFVDIVSESDKSWTDQYLATRILEYCINDA